MALAAEVARQIYEEVQDSTLANSRVCIPVSLRDVQAQWPSASQDEILRAYVIAYELLVLDVAEAVAELKKPPLRPTKGSGEEPS